MKTKFILGIAFVTAVLSYSIAGLKSPIGGIDSVTIAWIGLAIISLGASIMYEKVSKAGVKKSALRIYASIIFGVLARILYDSLFTSISHNIFPLELAFITAFTLPLSFLGSYAGNRI